MEISFSSSKRDRIRRARGLDLADAAELLLGDCFEMIDDRFDYGEERWVSIGLLKGEVVVCVWTEFGEDRVFVITMWKANENEQERYFRHLEGLD